MLRLMTRVRAFITALAVELSYASQIAGLHERNSDALTLAAHYHNLADTREVECTKANLQLEQSVDAWTAVNQRLIERVDEVHTLKQENRAQANLLLESYQVQRELRDSIDYLSFELADATQSRKAYFSMWKSEANYSSALDRTNDSHCKELYRLREQLANAQRENEELKQTLADAKTRSSFYRSMYMDSASSLAKVVFGDECKCD